MMERSATRWALVMNLGAVGSLIAGCNQAFDLKETEVAKSNFYTCACDCSQRVIAETGASVFNSPGGAFLDTALIGAQGSLLDGPEPADFNNQPATWWQVQFDSGPEGWVLEDALTVANETLVTKAPNVCLPQQFNPYLGGNATPYFDDLDALCMGEVADEAEVAIDELLMPSGRFLCDCGAKSAIVGTNFDSSCTKACTTGDVCLVAGFDPPDPTPSLLIDELLQPTSTCEVAGDVLISAGGHEPKTQPSAQGVLQVRGRPCAADAGCLVGMSYQLTSDDIEFDSGTIFADDPKFVDIGLSGATEADAINMGPFLGFHLGEVLADTAFSAVHGRRSGSSDAFAMPGKNTEGLALGINWPSKVCRIAGQLVGQATGDGDEGSVDAQVEVALDGVIVNQPPRPNAGPDQTVECTSPSGADVTLDASASTDADDNISFYEWREGSASGYQLAAPSASPVVHTQQALGQQTYYVLVADQGFAADRDSLDVSVADTTAPEIACNAPSTIYPSSVPEKRTAGISFTATASDGCTGVSSVAIASYSCTKPSSCRVGFEGATLTIFDSGGVGDVIDWVVVALDSAGNASQTTCELKVVKKK